MAKINPFELHPDIPRTEFSRKSNKLTIGQLNSVIADVTTRMHGSPNKTWGYSKEEVEYWLRAIIDEAEKITISKGNQDS